jgi:hypothetical protein
LESWSGLVADIADLEMLDGLVVGGILQVILDVDRETECVGRACLDLVIRFEDHGFLVVGLDGILGRAIVNGLEEDLGDGILGLVIVVDLAMVLEDGIEVLVHLVLAMLGDRHGSWLET